MATLKSITRGTVTLNNVVGTVSEYVDVTVTAVDLAKTFVSFTYKGGTDRGGHVPIAGFFTSTTNLRFQRKNYDAPDQHFTIEYEIIEWTSGVTVQTGTATNIFNSDGDVDVSITSVNTSKAFAFVTIYGYYSWDPYHAIEFVSAEITSSTNLRLKNLSVDENSNTVKWTVVEYDSCSVQKVSDAPSGTSDSYTIASVTTNKSAIISSYRMNNAGTSDDSALWNLYLSDATTITYARTTGGTTGTFIAYIVSFTDNSSVQAGEVSFGSGDTSKDTTISSINTAASIHFGANCAWNTFQCKSSNSGVLRTATAAKITSTTNLNSSINQSGTTGTFRYQVISFDVSTPATRKCSVQYGSTTLASGTTSTTAAITSIDTAKSWLVFSTKGSGSTDGTNEPGNSSVCGSISSATELSFARTNSTMGVTVQWFVITFSSGVSVQRGTDTNVSTTVVNKTITTVDTNKSFVVLSTASNDFMIRGQTIRADITTTTNLALDSDALAANEVRWQVIQYDNCSVQKIAKTISSGTSATDTITSVTLTKTFLAPTGRHSSASGLEYNFWHFRLSDATTLTYECGIADGTLQGVVYVVSFTDDATVSRYVTTVASSDTTTNTTVTIGQTTSAWIVGQDHSKNSSIDADSWWYVTDNAKAITSSSNVANTRLASGSAGETYWELIEHTALSIMLPPKWMHFRQHRL